MLEAKPHQVTVKLASDAPVHNLATTPKFSGSRVVKGLMTTKPPSELASTFGILLERPRLFLCEVADADAFHKGDEVSFNALTYVVAAPVVTYDAGDAADHAQVLLNELQYTATDYVLPSP